MSAAAPTYPVRYDDTPEGRASEYTRKYVQGQQKEPDYRGAVESIGYKKVAQMMREEAN